MEDWPSPWSVDLTFTHSVACRQIHGSFIVPVVTATYLAWDSVVVRLDPYAHEPIGP